MEISDLITFAAVARCGGITRAAKELHTVQSNVTSRIRSLEDEMGVALFERHSRGVVPTSAGLRLLPYAARAVMLVREATLAVRDDGEALGRLAVGAMETTLAVRLPSLLAAYHARHPAVELVVRTGPTAELMAKVLEGELDGAFVAGPIEHPLLVAEPAQVEELVLVTSRRWPTLAALRDDPAPVTALMFRAGCAYRQRLEHLLVRLGRPNFQRLEFGTLEGMLGCTAADVGLTLLPRQVVAQSAMAAEVVVHEVEPAIAQAPTLFIRRADAREGTAMRRFRDCVAELAAGPSAGPVPAAQAGADVGSLPILALARGGHARAEPVAAELHVQRALGDAEFARRARQVAARREQDRLDLAPLGEVEAGAVGAGRTGSGAR